MIILISDGYSSDLSGGHDQEIARQLRGAGIVVYACTSPKARSPTRSCASPRTGGEVFKPGDTGGLERVFERIDQMQHTRLEKTRAETLGRLPALEPGRPGPARRSSCCAPSA